jgi:hypothetical protein
MVAQKYNHLNRDLRHYMQLKVNKERCKHLVQLDVEQEEYLEDKTFHTVQRNSKNQVVNKSEQKDLVHPNCYFLQDNLRQKHNLNKVYHGLHKSQTNK